MAFNIAYELWTPGSHSGVGPMGNVLPNGLLDPNADTYGRYNATVGTRHLLRCIERHGLAARLLTSGMVAENHADHLRALSAAGHKTIGHGYAQNLLCAILSAEQDAAFIA